MSKIVPPFVRSAFNYDLAAASDETAILCPEPSLAVESERDDADINVIVKRFGLLGSLPQGVRVPSYGDFTGVSDYQSALNLIAEADDAFMTMPPDVRARFHNNPAEFLDFVNDASNRAEAEKLGLVVPGTSQSSVPSHEAPVRDGAAPSPSPDKA